MSDKVQGSEYLTHPASQTRFCLGALDFTLTHPFCTTPYAGMGVDFGGTADLILPVYNRTSPNPVRASVWKVILNIFTT